MTSKHYRWQTAWTVDPTAFTTTHALGLTLQWSRDRQDPPAAVCGDWCGRILGGGEALERWLDAHNSIRDPRSRATRTQRAMREAAEVWRGAVTPSPRYGGN